MQTDLRSIVVFPLALLSIAAPRAEQHPPMPAGTTHEEHLAQIQKDAALKKRGAAVVGFDLEHAPRGERPPGGKTMQQRLGVIRFRYEDTPGGGRVVIQTADREAKTGDQE